VSQVHPEGKQGGTVVAAERERPGVFLMTNTLETGGSERQFAVLAQGLDRSALDVHLGCLRNVGPLSDELEGLVEFPPCGSLVGWKSQKARLALSRHLRSKQIAVVNSFDFYANLMLIPAARWAGIPAIFGSHRQIGDLLSPAQFMAQRAAFHFCDRVICNSCSAAAALRDRGGLAERKLVVIGNALPDALFEETAPAVPKTAGALRVGMIARMNDPSKNHAGFLEMAARLATKYRGVEFLLAGDGPLRAGIEAQAASSGLGSRITFLGDRRDVSAVLASIDVSVLTSRTESLSNVILESMAAGIPVVAARVGGNPELVQDGVTGFLVPANDETAVADAVGKLMDHPELRRDFGTAARVVARERFSLRAITRQYEDLYFSVLEEKGWSPESQRAAVH